MDMIAVHAAAVERSNPAYHEFLTRYSKNTRVVYGFVEGRQDPSYYRSVIEARIPEVWQLELWPTGSKDRVLEVHSWLDWRRFSKKRICFFVDRDLSDVVSRRETIDSNIYVTDQYSIENSIVTPETCRRVLSEVCGFDLASHGELEAVCKRFAVERDRFVAALAPLTAAIICWRRQGDKANLQNIQMQKMFDVVNGYVSVRADVVAGGGVAAVAAAQCGVACPSDQLLHETEQEIRSLNLLDAATRGKFLMWFLVAFCKSVVDAGQQLCPSLTKPPAPVVPLGSTNSIAVIGPRARIPGSLAAFVDINYQVYVRDAVVVGTRKRTKRTSTPDV